MKQLTKEQKNENVTKLINYVNDYFSVERVEKVKELFRLYYNRILNDPASSRGYYHSCYNGGWLIHTINVIDCALKLSKLWLEQGANQSWSEEEIVFSAMFHDFGKLGDDDKPYYTPETSQWHRDKLQQYYNCSGSIDYLKIAQRGLFILQKHNITYTDNEHYGILLSDGLFDTDNMMYFTSTKEGPRVLTNIHILIHHADMMAARIETEKHFRGE